MQGFIRILFACALFAALTLELGCTHSVSPESGKQDLSLSFIEKKVVSASGGFAFDLLGKISEEERGRNFFVSPLSVSVALAMTLNGAEGQTYDDMKKTLGLEGLSDDEINQSYQRLIALFGKLDSHVKFTIANSIWCRNTFPVPDTFINVNKEYFDADVRVLNFGDPGAADVINSWVSDKTSGKIKKILDSPIDPDVVMYLIDALYFNGTWKYTFDKNATKPKPFYYSDGRSGDVATMTVHDTLKYFSNEKFAVAELPYGNGDYSMLVLLPASASSLDELTGSLSSSAYQAILAGLRPADVQVAMPKFSVKYDTLLNHALTSLGMGLAFDDEKADFSRMKMADYRGVLFISRVIHSTYINVNEEGTEAAAATAVEMSYRSSEGGTGPVFFTVDRPFLFLIKENQENTVMFMGAVVDPVG